MERLFRCRRCQTGALDASHEKTMITLDERIGVESGETMNRGLDWRQRHDQQSNEEPKPNMDIATNLERLGKAGLVPVVRAPDAELALEASRALVAVGLTALEITMTVPEAPAVITRLRAEYAGKLLIGAGTVTNVRELVACLDAGAEFVVSPVLLPELIAPAHEVDVMVALGALTPTEVWKATTAGADVVKMFPASAVGGADYIRALKAPFPDVRLMPTGGVSLASLESFVNAGAFAVGLGEEVVDIEELTRHGPQHMTDQVRAHVEKFAEARRGI